MNKLRAKFTLPARRLWLAALIWRKDRMPEAYMLDDV
jgi:hypothetical protein